VSVDLLLLRFVLYKTQGCKEASTSLRFLALAAAIVIIAQSPGAVVTTL